MHAKSMSTALVALLTCSAPAFAAYTQATSDPVHIHSIYQNEFGSPFVYFTSTVNPACGGMYLYNITLSPPNLELRANKMAMALSAKMSEKRVVLEYFYDAGISGWAACYISGITIVD